MKLLLTIMNINLNYMKNLKLLCLAVLLIGFASCKKKAKEEPVPTPPAVPTGTVELIFRPFVENEDFELGKDYYAPGEDLYAITKLKFFLSKIGFVKPDVSEKTPISDTNPNGIFLVNLSNPNADSGTGGSLTDPPNSTRTAIQNSFRVSFKVEEGTYSGLKFNIGVPRPYNNADPTTAQYPLTLGQEDMYWNWNSGYIYLLAEGNTEIDATDFTFHLGIGGEARTMPISFGNVLNPSTMIDVQKDQTTTIIVNIDINKFFMNGDGTFYRLQSQNERNVHGGAYADMLRNNIIKAFSFESAIVQ
jgi:hypothetical protein